MIDSNKIIKNILGTGKVRSVRPIKTLKPINQRISKKRTKFSNYQKMKLKENLYTTKQFNKLKENLDKNLVYIQWAKEANKLKNKVERLGYPVQEVGIRSIGMDLSKNEMIDQLKEMYDYDGTPVDLFANIPSNSKLGIKMKQSKYKLNPKDWWFRIDTHDNPELIILKIDCINYLDSDYEGYVIKSKSLSNIDKIISLEESW